MKKLILSLFVGLIGFINFGYCDYLNGLQFITNVKYNGNARYETTPGQLGFPTNEGLFCFSINGWGGSNRLLITRNGTDTSSYRFQTDRSFGIKLFGCFQKSLGTDNIPVYISSEYSNAIPSFDIDFYYIPTSNYDVVSGDPGYTKGECQLIYNLIPIENVDQHYCETNELCPSCEICEEGTGVDWSALFINNIQHQSAPLINITIPEEFNWDYTSDEEEFNLSVEGYNVDTEYIDGIIRTQNYKPTSEDFTQLVGMLAPYSKYLLFLLFIFIIWAWIKKPFKSKKL